MEFNFKEVTITIIIGAYFLFGMEFLFYIFIKRSISLHLLDFFERRKITPHAFIVVAIIFCFACGMLVEALSDRTVDEDGPLHSAVFGRIKGSKTDDAIKRDTLFGEENTPLPLTMEFAHRDLFRLYGGRHGDLIQTELLCYNEKFEKISPYEREKVAKSLYYHAKNMVYKEATYFNELQKIQLRIDFARSCAATSAFLFITAVFLSFAAGIGWFYRYRSRKKYSWLLKSKKLIKGRKELKHIDLPTNKIGHYIKVITRTSKIIKLRIKIIRCCVNIIKKIFPGGRVKIRIYRFIIVFIIVTVSFFAGVFAYNAEEVNFDKRAFGYFSSMNSENKSQTVCTPP